VVFPRLKKRCIYGLAQRKNSRLWADSPKCCWAPPTAAHIQTTPVSTPHGSTGKRTRRAPDLTSPDATFARHTPSSKSNSSLPNQTPCHFPHPHRHRHRPTTSQARCFPIPATTGAPRRHLRRRARSSPPRSPPLPRPSPPPIRWAPAVICPPPRPFTPRAGTGAARRGWSLPRATWLPPPPRRPGTKVTGQPLPPRRYLAPLACSRAIGYR
jgi:hypothetical protein